MQEDELVFLSYLNGELNMQVLGVKIIKKLTNFEFALKEQKQSSTCIRQTSGLKYMGQLLSHISL